ncbi:MAG TPA: hypothetical protein VHN39_10980 [Phenylobacterium sp.]|jgi:hypothetical protein|nr:hypothetical protein [Phenylobacterium sp.]
MNTFLVERTIPAAFHAEDPEQVALHARWAVDAYRDVGAFWIGGVITEDRMWSLVTAEAADDLTRYRQSLGIADQDMTVRRVVRPIGPYFAAPRGSVRPIGAAR